MVDSRREPTQAGLALARRGGLFQKAKRRMDLRTGAACS
jgi:hypothetical protein